jgi:hypothetical protein
LWKKNELVSRSVPEHEDSEAHRLSLCWRNGCVSVWALGFPVVLTRREKSSLDHVVTDLSSSVPKMDTHQRSRVVTVLRLLCLKNVLSLLSLCCHTKGPVVFRQIGAIGEPERMREREKKRGKM